MARDIRQTAICTGCGLEYSKLAHRKWITWRCLPCLSKYDKQSRINRGHAYKLLAAAKHRAKINNLECDIELSDIIIPNFCPVLGIPIVQNQSKQSNNSPSVDRLDNNKGYTKDNICIMSLKANRIKNDSTLEELKLLIKFLENR